jgi:uncharacterized protein (TIGR00369 family)
MTETTAEKSDGAGARPRPGPSPEGGGSFVDAAGLVVDEANGQRVVAHIEVGPSHHTPWGIVHGGVYATAVESAARIGGCLAVEDRELVAVGLTNTTHFLRSITAGRVRVDAVPLNQGRTQQLWRVDITDESERLIAHGEVRLQNVAPSTR